MLCIFCADYICNVICIMCSCYLRGGMYVHVEQYCGLGMSHCYHSEELLNTFLLGKIILWATQQKMGTFGPLSKKNGHLWQSKDISGLIDYLHTLDGIWLP